jgi:phosphate transport system substrate-binding protein
MTMKSLLMGASALAGAALAVAGGAQAQVTTQIYGGGSTLIAPYLRQAADCWGNPTDLVNQGTFPYGAGSESFTTVTPFNYPGFGATAKQAQNCATTHTSASVQINYIGSGSGNGELGVVTKDETNTIGVTTDGAAGHEQYPAGSIQFGAGDYGLSASEVSAANNGGPLAQKLAGNVNGSKLVSILPDTTNPNQYPNGLANYGAFIQVPISIDPVAIAYSSVYKVKTDASDTPTYYKFNIHKKNADGSGGLLLDVPTVCAIFNGKITNWNDPALTKLNGGVSLKDTTDPDAFSVPIEMVGRSDSSGTTSIFYRAMAAQCGQGAVTYTEAGDSYSYTNAYLPAGGKTLPLTSGQVYLKTAPDNGPDSGVTPVLGQFTIATGTSAVAKYLAFTYLPPASSTYVQGRITYIGTDVVLPAVLTTGANTYNLNVANIEPAPGKPGIEPTAANALKAFGAGANALLPPQSTTGGVYAPTGAAANSFGLRSHAEDWVEPISTTVSYEGGTPVNTPLADPNHNIPLVTTAYPFVGTTQLFLDTCYAGATVAPAIKSFLNFYENGDLVNDAKAGLLVKAGLAPLPKAWVIAIYNTFAVPTKTTATKPGTDALNLNILNGNSGPATGAGSQCHSVAGA